MTENTHSEKVFFILAGEKSADLYGAMLIKSLRKKYPSALYRGLGGPAMEEEGFISFVPFSDFCVMGISAVIPKLYKIIKNFYILRKEVLKTQPSVVICIDQPAFSLRFAKSLRKAGFRGKIVQYVAPTVWVYKKERALEIEKYYDQLLTLFSFEPTYFNGIDIRWVGHPIVEMVSQEKADTLFRKRYHLTEKKKIIALFPGSRLDEIQKNLPLMCSLMESIGREEAVAIACSVASNADLPLIAHIVEQSGLQGIAASFIFVPFEERFDLMKNSHMALAKSGTVTLEIAIHQVPTVVLYKLSFLTEMVAKYQYRITLPHFCIANILAKQELFPEFIKPPVDLSAAKKAVDAFYYDEELRSRCKEGCQKILRTTQAEKPASLLASQAIESLL